MNDNADEAYLDSLIKDGISALENEDFDGAILIFRKALKDAPFRPDIKELLSKALEAKPLSSIAGATENAKDKKSAKKKSKRTKRKNKKGFRPGLWLLIFFALSLFSMACFMFFSSGVQTFIKKFSTPPKEEVKLSEADIEAGELYKTAELLQDQRRFSEAIEAMLEAISKNPTNMKQFEYELAELYYENGEELYKKDQYTKSISSYEKAVKYNNESNDYYYGLGFANFIQGRKNQNRKMRSSTYFKKAITAFTEILKKDEKNTRAMKALARVYIARNTRGDVKKAAEMYRRIVKIAPDSLEADRAEKVLKSMGMRL
jgi:tetratricopeptide (TPR) repeat protein